MPLDLDKVMGEVNPFDSAPPKQPVIPHSAFPTLIDNTAREQYNLCPQKFFRGTIQKLAPDVPSIHLHFGGAYAQGLEAMRKAYYVEHKDKQQALEIGIEAATQFWGDPIVPEKSNKNYASLCGALVSYCDEYPLDTDAVKPVLYGGAAAVEFTFAVPIPECYHPETGDPLLYGGRFDFLGEYQNALFVVDDKTTSQLGQSWGKQWTLNSQFTGYIWGAKQMGIEAAGAIIRGQSILKSSFGHAQAIIYRPQWQIDRWLEMLVSDVQGMIADWKSGKYKYALGGACANYGGCEFLTLCSTNDPDPWIQSHYRIHLWNPLAKNPEEAK